MCFNTFRQHKKTYKKVGKHAVKHVMLRNCRRVFGEDKLGL